MNKLRWKVNLNGIFNTNNLLPISARATARLTARSFNTDAFYALLISFNSRWPHRCTLCLFRFYSVSFTSAFDHRMLLGAGPTGYRIQPVSRQVLVTKKQQLKNCMHPELKQKNWWELDELQHILTTPSADPSERFSVELVSSTHDTAAIFITHHSLYRWLFIRVFIHRSMHAVESMKEAYEKPINTNKEVWYRWIWERPGLGSILRKLDFSIVFESKSQKIFKWSEN